jgi:hypothetical protein
MRLFDFFKPTKIVDYEAAVNVAIELDIQLTRGCDLGPLIKS